jgi:hypothetical protein
MSNEYDPFDNEARAELDAARKDAAELERIEEAEGFKWLMGSKRGRAIMARLLAKTGLYRSSFSGEDTVAMAFNEGQRNHGLWLMAMIETHCPERFVLMLQEKNT